MLCKVQEQFTENVKYDGNLRIMSKCNNKNGTN